MMKRLAYPLFLLASALAPAHAEMAFETKLIEIQASPDDKTVRGEFSFEIKGRGEVIKNYDAKCTCLEARVEPTNPDRSTKLVWKIGEKGKIMAQFDVSNFRGTVDKAIELNLVDGDAPIVLTVRVHVPELVKMEPSSHKWDVGSSPDAKTFRITVNHSEPIHILSHSGNNPNFPYEIKTIKEGWEYEVTVKPKSTTSSGIGMLSFRTDCKFARFNRNIAYVVVRPKLAGGNDSAVLDPKTEK
ncbi:MAG: DUF1573 domain-containing protein [Akkermansiaceae bacterium]|jgi:hypothetical protein